VNAAYAVVGWPSGLVTTTSTVPGACGGATAVSWPEFTKLTSADAVPPNVTVGVLTKPLPLIVTVTPPTVVSVLGESGAVMVGPLAVSVRFVALYVVVNARPLPKESDSASVPLRDEYVMTEY
jgi:hypothetical protein